MSAGQSENNPAAERSLAGRSTALAGLEAATVNASHAHQPKARKGPRNTLVPGAYVC